MERNNILSFAQLLCRFILMLCYLFFALLLVILFYWHIDPAAFSNVEVTQSFKAGFGVNDIQIHPRPLQHSEGVILLSELNQVMVFWLFIRASLFLMLTIPIIKRILQVLKSIDNLSTFYNHNIGHFQRIASYSFFAFVLSCFNFSYLERQFMLYFKLALVPLAFAVGALVLAEIFKEGKQLLEDQKMII